MQLEDQKSDQKPRLNRFTFEDAKKTTKIVYFPRVPQTEPVKLPRGPQLDYQGPEGQFTFSGTEIEQQQSRLGLLISVTLKPNLDAGGLDLTLVLPPINSAKEQVEFETIAIKTTSQGLVVDPIGAFLTYEVLSLKGVALLPLSATSESSKSMTDTGDIQTMQVPQPTQKVLEITGLRVQILESFPVQLQVLASGTVPSAGWSNPQLLPYTYVQAPPDGIYDFDFVATPPEISAPVISPIRVRTIIPGEGIKGIRVHASLNSKEFRLNLDDAPCNEAQALG